MNTDFNLPVSKKCTKQKYSVDFPIYHGETKTINIKEHWPQKYNFFTIENITLEPYTVSTDKQYTMPLYDAFLILKPISYNPKTGDLTITASIGFTARETYIKSFYIVVTYPF